jgi:hypothetical protein
VEDKTESISGIFLRYRVATRPQVEFDLNWLFHCPIVIYVTVSLLMMMNNVYLYAVAANVWSPSAMSIKLSLMKLGKMLQEWHKAVTGYRHYL